MSSPPTDQALPLGAGFARRMLRRAAAQLPRGRSRVARALSRIMRDPFVDVVEPSPLDIRLLVDPSDVFHLEIWLGAYQPHVVSFLRKTIQPGMTVLCAGLHIGYVAAIAARRAGPTGNVFTAEPDEAARQRARANLARQSRLAPVHVFEGGLSDTSAVLTLHQSSVLGHSSFACEHQPAGEQRATVTTGDAWLASLGVSELDVIVLDVEGWELHALRGLEQTLARSTRLAGMVEVADWALRAAGTSTAEVVAFLRDRDMEVRWATEHGPHYPFGVWGPLVEDPNAALSNDVLCVRR